MKKNKKKIIYAPVLIPTLNRYKHLKKCITSLSKNNYAKYTGLIISVDFPPEKKYLSGNKKIISFLNNNEVLKKFKSVKIFYQNKNLGATLNAEFLLKYVKTISDRYIFTEDDNEFSKCFIEYIDKGLTLFNEDKNIFAICGCNEAGLVCNNGDNITLSKVFSPYGTGNWIKNEKILNREKYSLFFLNANSTRADKKKYKDKLKKLRSYNSFLYNMFISCIVFGNKEPFWTNGRLNNIDTVKSIFIFFKKLYTIMPESSNSHTLGFDGSGVNQPLNNDKKGFNLLNDRLNFDFKVKNKLFNINNCLKPILDYNLTNDKIYNNFFNETNTFFLNFKVKIEYVIYLLFGFDRIRSLKFKNILKRYFKL